MCIRIYIFNSKRKNKKKSKKKNNSNNNNNKSKITRRQKEKKTKKEERISVENLMVYDDIVCKFAMSTLTDLIFS